MTTYFVERRAIFVCLRSNHMAQHCNSNKSVEDVASGTTSHCVMLTVGVAEVDRRLTQEGIQPLLILLTT